MKTIRDIYDSMEQEEYYSRDCECGYYDNVNYHLRSYLYLEDRESQSIIRIRKIDKILKSQ